MYDNNLKKEYSYHKGDSWGKLLSNISKIESSLDKLGEAGEGGPKPVTKKIS